MRAQRVVVRFAIDEPALRVAQLCCAAQRTSGGVGTNGHPAALLQRTPELTAPTQRGWIWALEFEINTRRLAMLTNGAQSNPQE